jgi:hypothetical protein
LIAPIAAPLVTSGTLSIARKSSSATAAVHSGHRVSPSVSSTRTVTWSRHAVRHGPESNWYCSASRVQPVGPRPPCFVCRVRRPGSPPPGRGRNGFGGQGGNQLDRRIDGLRGQHHRPHLGQHRRQLLQPLRRVAKSRESLMSGPLESDGARSSPARPGQARPEQGPAATLSLSLSLSSNGRPHLRSDLEGGRALRQHSDAA